MPNKLQSRGVRSEACPRALEKWNPAIRSAEQSAENTITIYGHIGSDYWYGDGVTVARIDAALRAIGDHPVTVYINSPGGDMFEGLAIYNRLREHSQPVTTKVVGLAASAASVIAMAGHVREIGLAAFLMIHNCWTYLAGNRNFLRDVADDMEEFDLAMADLYALTSGQDLESVTEMMDDETYIRGKRAVELGFATELLESDEVAVEETDESKSTNALKAMDMALIKAGLTRSERRALISDFKTSMRNAAEVGMPNAAPVDKPRAVAPNFATTNKVAIEVVNILISKGGNHAN